MAKFKDTKEKDKPVKPKETTAEFISSMAAVFITGLFIVTFNLQAFEIPSTSMKNTLLVGDRLFVDRTTVAPKTSWVGPVIPYSDIRRNDIIVFISPKEPGLYVVKRIIGVPGDRIHLVNGKLFRNGEPVDEPYVVRNGTYDPYRDEFPSQPPPFDAVSSEWHVSLNTFIQGGDLMVPEGGYFAMGDNRDVSYDSRYWGFIPRANVIGRPMFIFWSFETPEGQYRETGLANRVKNFLTTALHFFDQTRWRRTFRLVR
ncbi:MAG TPA: signal peptidase I [Terriglobales bacterium]|nr:signal peptidase I [Terriglobales bacterium]